MINLQKSELVEKETILINGDGGARNELGEGENEKWEQTRQLEMKLLIGLGFRLVFVPLFFIFLFFHFPFSPCLSPFPVFAISK